ncbi:MAG: hypothetical protein RLZZ528_2637 [Pseudomonadota bacterium]
MDRMDDVFADLAGQFGLSRPAGRCLSAIWRAEPRPCADDLVAGLGLSRSNVSTALKELREWGLAAIHRDAGDRKEYYTAPADPWDLVAAMVAARRQRVTAPLLDRLLRIEARGGDVRAAALHETVSALDDWQERLGRLAPADFARALLATAPAAEGKKKKKKKG